MANKQKDNNAFISFLERITTLHGTKEFTTKSGRSRTLWTVVMIANILVTIAFILVIKQKFNEGQLYTAIDANCKVNQVPFPTVSICNFNMVSFKESRNIARVLKHYNKTDEEIQNFLKSLPFLKNFDKESTNTGNFTDIMAIMKHHFFTMDTIMEEIHQKCEDLLVYCAFNRKPRNCEEMFVLIKTYEGHCCTFNYAALNDARAKHSLTEFNSFLIKDSEPTRDLDYKGLYSYSLNTGVINKDTFNTCCTFPLERTSNMKDRTLKDFVFTNKLGPLLPPAEDLEYYDDHSDEGTKAIRYPNSITTLESGRRSGLSVVLNVEPEDYPSWSFIPYYGVKVILSDPNDYPETTVLYRYITLGESVDIKVEPLVFQSDPSIRSVEPEKRECWFHDEAPLEHTDRYSYETCRTECKMKNYVDKCKCVPYKYPREKSTRICDFQDLKCLNNVTVYQSNDDIKCNPVCFMECWDKKYSVTSDLTPFLSINYPEEATAGMNVSDLAALQVFFGKSTCNCYKLTLLNDFNYFIATYGGVFSLSFGGSIITLVEITYLLLSVIVTALFQAIVPMMSKK